MLTIPNGLISRLVDSDTSGLEMNPRCGKLLPKLLTDCQLCWLVRKSSISAGSTNKSPQQPSGFLVVPEVSFECCWCERWKPRSETRWVLLRADTGHDTDLNSSS